MMKPTVVLTASDQTLIKAVREMFSTIENIRLEVVDSPDAARSWVGQDDVPLVIVHMDEGRSISEVSELLQSIVKARSSIATLVITDHHSPSQERAMLRLGVVDYLARPLDIGRLAYLIDVLTLRSRALAPRAVPVAKSPESPDRQPVEENMLDEAARSPMSGLMDQVRRVAMHDTTILLGGETGTGKSRLAGWIHRISPRKAEPFLTINCGALSSSLIESEMFGHLKGAFTGAEADRVGKFAAVGRGTLFLDEVDSLPLDLQVKLLRAIEERVFEPVGSNKSQPMQARLIAACNRPLEGEIAAGRFRADLYYRINVFSVVIPPLREHPWDIPRLVSGFIDEFTARTGRSVQGISSEALRALAAHPWPGNIRELRNAIELAMALCPGPWIQLEDLPNLRQPAEPITVPREPQRSSPSSLSLPQTRCELERRRIAESLQRNKNNRLRAAAELGISRMTLYNKLHKYGMIDA